MSIHGFWGFWTAKRPVGKSWSFLRSTSNVHKTERNNCNKIHKAAVKASAWIWHKMGQVENGPITTHSSLRALPQLGIVELSRACTQKLENDGSSFGWGLRQLLNSAGEAASPLRLCLEWTDRMCWFFVVYRGLPKLQRDKKKVEETKNERPFTTDFSAIDHMKIGLGSFAV